MIEKLPNGKYFVYTVDSRGNKIRKVLNRKEDAEALVAIYGKERYDNKLVRVGLRKQRYLLAGELSEFEISKTSLSPKTFVKYKHIIKQISIFAEKENIKYLDGFTPDHGTSFINEVIREKRIIKDKKIKIVKVAPKTANAYIVTLKAFFQEQVSKDHLVKSPVLHLKQLKVEGKKPDYYKPDELKKFFGVEILLPYRNLFLGLLLTGARIGEAINLTWDDVNFESRLVFIRSKDTHKLKTSNSERAVPMSQGLFDLLETILKHKNSEYVFSTSNGTAIRERKALEKCKDVATRAGIGGRSYLHKFRATYATILVRNKTPLESIKELLGHSSLIETEKAYANNESNHMHNEVEILDNFIK
ncbi:MAG: site-specific integrase [Ignavibacteriaceae bacterium]|nr:site-specific integrase [Ignavibacteriaceae bacterium]